MLENQAVDRKPYHLSTITVKYVSPLFLYTIDIRANRVVYGLSWLHLPRNIWNTSYVFNDAGTQSVFKWSAMAHKYKTNIDYLL